MKKGKWVVLLGAIVLLGSMAFVLLNGLVVLCIENEGTKNLNISIVTDGKNYTNRGVGSRGYAYTIFVPSKEGMIDIVCSVDNRNATLPFTYVSPSQILIARVTLKDCSNDVDSDVFFSF